MKRNCGIAAEREHEMTCREMYDAVKSHTSRLETRTKELSPMARHVSTDETRRES